MQHVASAFAHVPWLHHEVSAWCVALGQGQQTGVQSAGSEHADPAAPIFHGTLPAAAAQVESMSSVTLSTDFGSFVVVGPELHVADAGVGGVGAEAEEEPQAPHRVRPRAAPRAGPVRIR